MESMLSHGNLLINFSQKRLCELTGINKSTMSKVFTTLKNKKCLIENNDNTYLNSVIFMKGLPQKLFIQYRDHFLKSIEYKLSSDEYFEEIFDDKFIETYQKSLEGIKDKKKQMQKAEKEKALKNFKKQLLKKIIFHYFQMSGKIWKTHHKSPKGLLFVFRSFVSRKISNLGGFFSVLCTA